MTTENKSYFDHLEVMVTYPDGKGNHTTTIGELKQRFKEESKAWRDQFIYDIVNNGCGYTRSGTYELKNLELHALQNAIKSFGLTGYEIHESLELKKRPNRANKYLLIDNKGNSLTGWWHYPAINHFILGYGKASANYSKLVEENANLHKQLNAESDYQALQRDEKTKLVEENERLIDLLIDVKDWFYLNAKRKHIPLNGVGSPAFFEKIQPLINNAKNL